MTEEQYKEIINKQQELISLLLCQNNSSNNTTEFIIKSDTTEAICEYDSGAFILFLQNKGLSENTVYSYSDTVKKFFETYKELTHETLKTWEQDMAEVYKPKSINLRQNGMRRYFEFIGYEGYSFRKYRTQKNGFTDNVINDEQYQQLVEYTQKHKNETCYKIIRIIASTGVRVSELIRLKSIDLQKGYSDIVSKENKMRRIYYPSQLVNDIIDKCPYEYMITNRFKQQMTTRGVSVILKSLASKSGVPKEVVYPHSFRHYFAKTFIKNGGDITLLGDLLGHSDISTTALYTRKTTTEQKLIVSDIVKW